MYRFQFSYKDIFLFESLYDFDMTRTGNLGTANCIASEAMSESFKLRCGTAPGEKNDSAPASELAISCSKAITSQMLQNYLNRYS
jgi:hypothetical protein